jgi:hypothetical protein
VKASLSDDAAKTVMDPAAVSDGLETADDVAELDALLPHAVRARAARVTTTVRWRRTGQPLGGRGIHADA